MHIVSGALYLNWSHDDFIPLRATSVKELLMSHKVSPIYAQKE